ncbi:VOC family protein [Lacicoccus qingdaonensis]|uniref:Glyoxalase superfamily enzyme, possibly 3-demethylubiquinone-9 3-methyltransferase n=1 Tax=Lacicoccus qingdaonensis TaxID=576118 RepID=A0A1G9B9I5_9BACL|nr:VOC family protein [Salinicoccus qingdaonensis]SDK36123.1 Glyoxalase superfamily enzyme, possibly 3-demethylubiquinone-9 3-methyltransferase [Salinicoccus qingdaonensis]
MKSLLPFLTFNGNAMEALNYYKEVFYDLDVEYLQEYGPETPELTGKIMQAVISLNGQQIMLNDSSLPEEFNFTPSMSFYIECRDLNEIELYYRKLKRNAAILVPLDEYGPGRHFAHVQDRFGLSWQLNFSK